MQDTSKRLTRWSIQLQSFDFTVKHVPGKLNFVPDALPSLFGDTNGEDFPSESPLAAIRRNVPENQPYYPPSPREYKVCAHNFDDVVPVQSDRDLFMSTVSSFPLVDPAHLAAQTTSGNWPVL